MDNVADFPNIDRIKDEATMWVVKVHGFTDKTKLNIPNAEADELKAWLAQSDKHRDYFLKTMATWDAMGVLEQLADILPLVDVNEKQKKRHAPEKANDSNAKWSWLQHIRFSNLPRIQVLGLSGALTATFTAVVWFLLAAFLQQPVFITGVGEQANYVLSDGSAISLNTNSELHVDYSDARRVVTLVRGEATFNVQKDKTRPFLVQVGQGVVWAVGTSFNIHYNNGYVDVMVSEGVVKVFSGIAANDKEPLLEVDNLQSSDARTGDSTFDPAIMDNAQAVVLNAGEAAKYTDVIISSEALDEKSMKRKLAWQVGTLIFEGENLRQAIQEISRYTDRPLIIVDASVGDIRVGGRFQTKDIDALVNSLAQGLDIKVVHGENNSILFSEKI
ncbi:MAG: hypothetical protein GYB26_09900 [Gammaproteobacteria bacterium]|nr:hypothetical protein [Gammaproteobacteria bacterium]